MKIGEALIKSRLITEDQLKVALERQKTFGGRIDTNLVEAGFLNNEKLTRFLGQFLKLPVVTSDLINSIPVEIIVTLSKEVAEKYGLLPFKREGNRLHIAMLNPGNLKDIEDLRFKTSFDIIPYVITELSLRNALERYYGIKKTVRHISMDTDFGNEMAELETSESRFLMGDTGKGTEGITLEEIKKALTVEEAPGRTTELIGALLSNAFFTAKLFHESKRSNLTDSQIEDEVMKNWARFQKKCSALMSRTDKN